MCGGFLLWGPGISIFDVVGGNRDWYVQEPQKAHSVHRRYFEFNRGKMGVKLMSLSSLPMCFTPILALRGGNL